MDRTLILVKPDAFGRGLTGEVIARFERKGLRIVAMKHMTVTRELAEEHTPSTRASPSSATSWSSSPVDRWWHSCSTGTRAVTAARQVIGATNPLEAAPGSIRGDFGLEVQTNLVHGSDSPESAAREARSSSRTLILASGSPQRRAILEQLGGGLSRGGARGGGAHRGAPRAVVVENALRKARAVEGGLVLGWTPRWSTEARAGQAARRGGGRAVSWRPVGRGPRGDERDRAEGRGNEGAHGRGSDSRALPGARAARHRLVPRERRVARPRRGYAIQGRGAALVEEIEGDYLQRGRPARGRPAAGSPDAAPADRSSTRYVEPYLGPNVDRVPRTRVDPLCAAFCAV